jgi:23S rRNA (guanosine2251-2'-O)-methyltransferase
LKEWLYGRNPVFETLRAGRRHTFRLLVAQGAQEKGRLHEILRICSLLRLPVERVPRPRLEAIHPGNQGVALEASAYPYADLTQILDLAKARAEPPLILVLDTLQDPQNLGTLLRTAEAVGAHGVLLPFRRTALVTPAVVSASSGACEHLLIAQTNLTQAIERLKEAGIWVAGLEAGEEAQPPGAVDLSGPLALVVGGEGEGLRPLVRRSCDFLVRLPMRGRIESLNAAVAGSISLYLAWGARGYQ